MEQNSRPAWNYRLANSLRLYGKDGNVLHEAHSCHQANDIALINYTTHIAVRQSDFRSTTERFFYPGDIREIEVVAKNELEYDESILDW